MTVHPSIIVDDILQSTNCRDRITGLINDIESLKWNLKEQASNHLKAMDTKIKEVGDWAAKANEVGSLRVANKDLQKQIHWYESAYENLIDKILSHRRDD